MTDNLMSTVHPSVMHSETFDPFDPFDPFGRDPEPAPSRRERALLVLALAAIVGLGAGALATLVLPRGATADAALGGRPTTSAATTPNAPVAGSALPVMVAGAARPAGTAGDANAGTAENPGSPDGGSGGGNGPGTPSPPVTPVTPVSLVANVQITSPSGGAAHTAGKPLFLKVVATHPITGAPVPGYRLHWTVTRSGGHLVRTATGTTSVVHGALITAGTYRVRVEVQAKGLVGADEVTLIVPLDLAPKPTPVPPSPKPTPQVSGPSDLTVPLPDPHE